MLGRLDQEGLTSLDPEPISDTPSTTSPQGEEFEGNSDDLDMLPPINVRNDIGISDQDLIEMPVTQLNKFIKSRGISKEGALTLKQKRRTLKNRRYAADGRVKKENTIERYTAENEELRKKLDATRAETESVNVLIAANHETILSARKELEILKKIAIEGGIKVPQAIETALSRLRFTPNDCPGGGRYDHSSSHSVESMLASKPEIRFVKNSTNEYS